VLTADNKVGGVSKMLSVIGVVHGKVRKYVVAARNQATVLRSIRYSYLISHIILASRLYLVCGFVPRSTLPFYKKKWFSNTILSGFDKTQ
jgi:hypothetical protein